MDHGLTTRNRKFLEKIVPYSSDHPMNTSTPLLVPDPAPVPPCQRDDTVGELPQPEGDQGDTRAVPTQPLQLDEPVEQQPRRSSRVRH